MIKKLHPSNLFLFFVAIITFCIVVGGIVFLNAAERPAHKFLLPEGFTGWVEVTYEQPGYPALKKEGRSFLYEIPPSGKIKTSSRNVTGKMVFYYVEQNGQLTDFPTDKPMIHGVNTSSGAVSGTEGPIETFPEKLTFFVGTEEQWREETEKQPVP